MSSSLNIVLIVGSAPDALMIKDRDLSLFSSCVVINNAWQLNKDWDYLIYPEDFPDKNLPPDTVLSKKKIITAREYVPEQNFFGGFVYGGGTMAFTAGYWALGALKPDIIAYLGCDMIYPSEKKTPSHFYGNGEADPLRLDITLQSLEAKSVRLMALAQIHNCSVVNLSKLTESRLLFPRTSITKLLKKNNQKKSLYSQGSKLDSRFIKRALDLEGKLAYMVPSGKYWESPVEFDRSKLSEIDSLWLKSASKLN